ncbi:unnamed protein product [Orchesella dallaii]|uniref:TMC domain-containing protein n=1 Tax=Orchesella dallaii TaxID=48710 RepID=A0ABP1QEB2_9HEXA
MSNTKNSINRFFATPPTAVHPVTSISESKSNLGKSKKVQIDVPPASTSTPSSAISTIPSTSDAPGNEPKPTKAPASRRFTIPKNAFLNKRDSGNVSEKTVEGTKDESGPNEPRKTLAARTFRIWHPQSDKKSIVVNVGKEADPNAEKVFDSENINSKGFVEWKKEAKAQLPSITGGSPVDTLDEVLEVGTAISKEDPKTGQQIVRRLSFEEKTRGEFQRKSVPFIQVIRHTLDYTAGRKSLRAYSFDEESIASTEVDFESDEDENERKQAGHDIKGKIKTLKELAEHLTSKRVIRQQLILKATGSTVLDTEEIPQREHVLYFAEYIHQFLHDVANTFTIWEKDINCLQSIYGVTVVSYFIWLRRVVTLNIFYFLFTLCLVIVPQAVQDVRTLNSSSMQPPFRFSDLLNGEGWLHHSYLYYSGYHPGIPKNHSKVENTDEPFKLPSFRFLFVIFIIFVVNTYFIFSRINKYYHSVRMESKVSGLAKMDNFKSIVCAWDFSCTDAQATINLHKTIRRELHILARASRGGKNIIEIEAEQKPILAYALKKFGVRWGPIVLHIVSNLLLLLCCFLLGIVLYFLCQLKLEYYLQCISDRDDGVIRKIIYSSYCPGGDTYLQTWIFSLPAIFASLTNLTLVRVIILVGDNEFWETTEIKVFATMIRAGIFYLTHIGVFYLFWLTSKENIQKEGFVAETLFGKELYRLVVIQGLADLIFNLGVKGLYHFLRKNSKHYKPSEFQSEYYSLSMFYMHSISIIGVLFCPGICFFITVRLVLDFYHHKFALLHLSSQETYSAHASSVYAPYLLAYFVCYLLTSFLNGYYISETKPSSLDGPFIDYSSISYDRVIADVLTGSKTNWLKHLAKAGFLVTFIIILGSLVYFCRQWGLAYEPIVEQLHEFILLERGDRDLLLKAIFDIGKATGVAFGDSATTTGLSTTASESEKENAKLEEDDQINRLIRHVQARGSQVTHVDDIDKKAQLWNAARHHREHMERMVATIVQSKRKSRYSYTAPAIVATLGRKKASRRGSTYSSASGNNTSTSEASDDSSNVRIPQKQRTFETARRKSESKGKYV